MAGGRDPKSRYSRTALAQVAALTSVRSNRIFEYSDYPKVAAAVA
jgi:hypothetical protein